MKILASALSLTLLVFCMGTVAYAGSTTYGPDGSKTVCGSGATVATASPAPGAGTTPPPTSSGGGASSGGGGIVTCGKGSTPCTIPDLLDTIQNLSMYLLKFILLPIAALSVAIAGGYILTGALKPGNIETGKAILWDVVYGLVVALSAYVIVKVIFKLLAVRGVTFQ